MTIFQFIEFENGKEVSSFYKWNLEDDAKIEGTGAIIKHKDLMQSKPSGNYSEVRMYRVHYSMQVIKASDGRVDEDTKKQFRQFLDGESPVIKYYQNLTASPKIQPNKELEILFPNNSYLGRILNHVLYLSPEQFEVMYAKAARKVENITKAFQSPSIKFTMKAGFLSGDQEVIIYQKDCEDGDICVIYMTKDHGQVSELIRKIHEKTPFYLLKNQPEEMMYQFFGFNSLTHKLPPRLDHANVIINVTNKLSVVTLGLYYEGSRWLSS